MGASTSTRFANAETEYSCSTFTLCIYWNQMDEIYYGQQFPPCPTINGESYKQTSNLFERTIEVKNPE